MIAIAAITVVALPFVPLFHCGYCWTERQEIHDWMRVVPRDYVEKHPEAIRAAEKDLDRLNERCTTCFRGRISFWQDLFWSQR